MNKIDIINEISRLNAELPLRKKIAEISEHEGLELAVNELTENCCASVKSKSYKNSINQIKDLKTIQTFQEYLQSQKDRIEAIHSRIAQLKFDLTRYQLSLFEDTENAKEPTNIIHDGRELYTGDIFEAHDKNFFVISHSQVEPNKFAILHSASDTELLLNYSKNREALNDTAYLGNLFDDEKLQEILDRVEAEILAEKNESTEEVESPEDAENPEKETKNEEGGEDAN